MNTTEILKQNLLKEININQFDYNDPDKTYQYDVALNKEDGEFPYADIRVKPVYKKHDRSESMKVDVIEVQNLDVYDKDGELQPIDNVEIEIFLSSQLSEF